MIDKIKVIKSIRSVEMKEDSITYGSCPNCKQQIPGHISLVKAKEIAEAIERDGLLKKDTERS